MWWNQGFYQAEDEAFRQTVADRDMATGNRQELTFHNRSAMTAGDVPEVVCSHTADFLLIPQSA